MGIVAEIYRRALAALRDTPWLFALPVIAELAQHAAEIRLGLYAGRADAATAPLRLAFGVAKLLVDYAVIVAALRIWRNREQGLPVRPGGRLALGLLTVIAVQFAGQAILVGFCLQVARLLGAAQGGRVAALAVGILLWILVLGAILPWYVGLLVDDRAMTLRRSIAGRMPVARAFGVQLAGYAPLMIAHYALTYGAIGRGLGLTIGAMLIDSVLVGLLVLAIASTFYAVYRRV